MLDKLIVAFLIRLSIFSNLNYNADLTYAL